MKLRLSHPKLSGNAPSASNPSKFKWPWQAKAISTTIKGQRNARTGPQAELKKLERAKKLLTRPLNAFSFLEPSSRIIIFSQSFTILVLFRPPFLKTVSFYTTRYELGS